MEIVDSRVAPGLSYFFNGFGRLSGDTESLIFLSGDFRLPGGTGSLSFCNQFGRLPGGTGSLIFCNGFGRLPGGTGSLLFFSMKFVDSRVAPGVFNFLQRFWQTPGSLLFISM